MENGRLGGVYGCKKSPPTNFSGFEVLQGK